MRRTAQRSIGGSRRPATVLAISVAGLVLLTGCATQVAGTALTPTSIPSSSSTPAVASMPTGAPTTSPSTDDRSSSDGTPTSDTSSPEETTSPAGSSSSASSDASTSQTSSASSTDTPGGGTTASGGAAVDPAAFAATLKAANAGVKSLRGSIAVAAASVKVTGTFGETLSGGQVTALDMSMFISEGSNDLPLRMLIVDRKVYIGGTTLLKSLNAGTKKWALASADSKNSSLRTLAAQLDGYLTTASANQYELYAIAAKSIMDGGPDRVGAVSAHRYEVVVDVAKLAAASPASARASMEALVKAGVTTLPATLWLDPSGRLLQSESTVKVSGLTSKSTFKVTGYNVAVSIKAPATADVYTG